MSKSTGGKGGSTSGSDNNSKGSNSSSNSGSDSEGSKGSSASTGSSGGRQGGDSNQGGNQSSKGSDTGSDTSSAPSSASDSAPTSSGAPTASATQESAARATLDTTTQDAYDSLVKGAVTPAPVRDAVGVDVATAYGTTMSDDEMNNLFSQAHHLQEASTAWGDNRFGDWASERVKASVDNMQGWGYQQARELTQAPLDKIADIARNPMAQGLAVLAGGLPGLALTSAIGIADSVADYAQDELSGKDAAIQGLGDVMAFAPAPVQTMYGLATNPISTAKRIAGQTLRTGNPIADVALNKFTGFGIDKMGGALMASDDAVRGPTLTAALQRADNSFNTSYASRSGGIPAQVPTVMNNDAMTLHWKMLAQQQANKPKYNQSMLFALGNRNV